jgi:hypothetical protein
MALTRDKVDASRYATIKMNLQHAIWKLGVPSPQNAFLASEHLMFAYIAADELRDIDDWSVATAFVRDCRNWALTTLDNATTEHLHTLWQT